MARTPKDVFRITMALIDSYYSENYKEDDNPIKESVYINEDNVEYQAKTVDLLNNLRGELYPYSDTYTITQIGKRPICPLIETFTSEIALDDYITETVMPYGLGALLLLSEDQAVANFFQQRYYELLAKLKDGLPTMAQPIEDVYGFSSGAVYDEFGNLIYGGFYPPDNARW